MPNNVRHFAINADDMKRSRRFYENVFGWKFEAYGPPDFYMIATGSQKDPGIIGSLQKRRELVPGGRMIGYECTVSVQSADETAKTAEANGGKVVLAKTILPTVGELVWIQDPEGNIFGAMKYEKSRAEMYGF